MINLIEFCEIYLLTRAFINTLIKVNAIATNVAITLTLTLSLIICSFFKFAHSISVYFINSSIPNFLSVLLTLYILNILFRDNVDKLSFAFEDSETKNYWSFWLSEFDKNIWKLGLCSILLENLIRNFNYLK